ncbi:uncharacterized protein AMSG_06508 [Thecamonas trahens ATCC 50062]|uniref:BTB domain-containing protein n=1 Tax=Thecamonas trahens ATCC 50062 TaxID=461836 RepID=A0A0L0DFQ7_THETB|nr:hypothetical protein AMSG_06508 [Thecamonas trahens ATCC 50062]KNC51157.1 hypothetical protein AMSG_06508 [Thecamonas trahens ATCC 50062]|eukprot:XP_013756359.1 hypothetical protein AMSG_06508 [Thecamonas trahens ATCC 50062]
MESEVDVSVRVFRRGFGQVLRTGEHADAEVVVGRRRYKVHRLILAKGSEFFATSFASSFTEAQTQDNAMALLAMADLLLIEPLRAKVLLHLAKAIDVDSVLAFLKQAILHAQSSILPLCLRTVSKNFHILADADLSFLPPDLFLDIMEDPWLAVKSEKTVFDAIGAYISARDAAGVPVPQDAVVALYETIRYPFMPYELLVEAQANPLVPQALLVEGLMARLRRHEGAPRSGPASTAGTDGTNGGADDADASDAGDAAASGDDGSVSDVLAGLPATADAKCRLRHTRRPPYSITLRYKADFDGGGVIHWIATDRGRGPWTNPALPQLPGVRPRIQITVSSLEKGEVAAFVALDPVQTWTKDVPASWITWDLGHDYSVVPTHYSLRHGGNYKADSLRNWDLQGSTDGVTWSVLRRHVNDSSLNGPFDTATWPIDDVSTPYRYFRILQSGHNSSRRNFLLLCGFELYGDLYIRNEAYA